MRSSTTKRPSRSSARRSTAPAGRRAGSPARADAERAALATAEREETLARGQVTLNVLVARAVALRALGGASVLEAFEPVPEQRHPQGLRHRLPVILTLCTAAVLRGETTVLDVACAVAHTDPVVLAAVGARRCPATGRYQAPSEDTVPRVLAQLEAADLDLAVGAWLSGRIVRVHGEKTGTTPTGTDEAGSAPTRKADGDGQADGDPGAGGRAARAAPGLRRRRQGAARRGAGRGGTKKYLLSVATHGDGIVVAQHEIGPKTNEVPALVPLLRELHAYQPLTDAVITVDAGHTVRAHGTAIRALGAHFVFTVKLNTPALHTDCEAAADWNALPVEYATDTRAHGRHEQRTIRRAPATAAIRARHPHARTVALIERYVTRTVTKGKGDKRVKETTTSAVSIFVITSLAPDEITAEELATYVQGHWTIENKVHWVRDVTYREDAPPGPDRLPTPHHGHVP